MVTLTGSVASEAQLRALESLTESQPGVVSIDNRVAVRSAIQPVANLEAPQLTSG